MLKLYVLSPPLLFSRPHPHPSPLTPLPSPLSPHPLSPHPLPSPLSPLPSPLSPLPSPLFLTLLQSLYHNDKLMPDPLSVSDIADVANVVKVKVSLLYSPLPLSLSPLSPCSLSLLSLPALSPCSLSLLFWIDTYLLITRLCRSNRL